MDSHAGSSPVQHVDPPALRVEPRAGGGEDAVGRGVCLGERLHAAAVAAALVVAVGVLQLALERCGGVIDAAAGAGVQGHGVEIELVHNLEHINLPTIATRPDAIGQVAEKPQRGPRSERDGHVDEVESNDDTDVKGGFTQQAHRVPVRLGVSVVDAEVDVGGVGGGVVDVSDEAVGRGGGEVGVIDVAACGVGAGESREAGEEVGAAVVGEEGVGAGRGEGGDGGSVVGRGH